MQRTKIQNGTQRFKYIRKERKGFSLSFLQSFDSEDKLNEEESEVLEGALTSYHLISSSRTDYK